jgi:3-phosphoshikimate 1-carboxyvinyltransferase
MRLLAGVLAGQAFSSTLVGDESLSRRPMERIAVPLRLMNAEVTLSSGCPPIGLEGGRLRSIHYPMPERSAQVKSCVLLAGLFAEGETTIIESAPTRDHTERMLGLPVVDIGSRRHVSVTRDHSLVPQTWTIPRDFSAAAFFVVAATLVPTSLLRLPGVGVNPSRSALLDVLTAMGASISVTDMRLRSGEPIADLQVEPAQLGGVDVGGDLIPNLIDEIPVLAVAATQAEGITTIRDAAELRVKETDRIAAIAQNLRLMGANVDELPDGLRIHGPTPLHGAVVDAFGDHRIAMAMGVAALLAQGPSTILGGDAAAVSYPGYWSDLGSVTFANEPPVKTPA